MRTVSFQDAILWPIVTRMGYDPNLDLFPEYSAAIGRYINYRVRRYWDMADFPELSAYEPRMPTNHIVPYDPPGGASSPVVVPGSTPIGRVLKVYSVDITQFDGPFDLPFTEYPTYFHCGYDHGTTVWVKFMTRPSLYSGLPWSSLTTYDGSDVVYDPVSGECYISLVDGNLNNPVTMPAFWAYVPFPLVLAEPVWHGAYADALREDGQTAKAQVEEQLADQELQLSIQRNVTTRYDKLTDQQTGVPRNQISPVSAAA